MNDLYYSITNNMREMIRVNPNPIFKSYSSCFFLKNKKYTLEASCTLMFNVNTGG